MKASVVLSSPLNFATVGPSWMLALGSRDPKSDSDRDVDKENDEKRLGNVRKARRHHPVLTIPCSYDDIFDTFNWQKMARRGAAEWRAKGLLPDLWII
jgi:hypothetical protein